MQNNPALALLLTIGFIQMWMMPAMAWSLLKGQRDVAARFWFAGTACYAGTASLFVLGRFAATDATSMFGFLLVTGMLACFAESLRRELQNTPTPWQLWSLALAANLGVVVLTDLLWGPEIMRVAQLALISLLDLGLLALLMAVIRRRRSRALLIVVVGFVAVILANLLRVLAFVSAGTRVDLLSFSWTSNLGFIANFLSVVLYSFGYGGFVIEKNRVALGKESAARQMAEDEESKALDREKSMYAVLKEREALIAELAKMQRAVHIGALAASIAHEVNQPLTSVRLSVEEAVDIHGQEGSQSRMTELLHRINSETQRAFGTVRTISNFFKDKPVVMEDRCVDDILRMVSELLKDRLNRQGVQMQMDLNAPVRAKVGSGELEHVILNLLTNALDAFEREPFIWPTIRICSGTDSGEVWVKIQDNGPGVALAVGETLFDMHKTSNPNGLGLGLWLSRYIAERYGGQLILDESQGAPGAAFTLKLIGVNE